MRLGSASAIYGAVQPGRFWLRQDTFSVPGGTTCMVVEVSVTGKALTDQMPLPCSRWLAAAVTSGFVSVPTTSANAGMDWSGDIQTWEFGLGGDQQSPEAPLQLWNPATGDVVRSYTVNPEWIDGVNSQYLVSQSTSQLNTGSVNLNKDLSSGATHQLNLPMGPGDELLNQPVLAPEGPYLAWTEVTSATLPTMETLVSPGCACAPILTGPGRVRVVDLGSGRLMFSRSLTVGSAGAFDWAPDGHYLFVTDSFTTVSVVPTWSETAPRRELKFDTSTLEREVAPASEELLIAARTMNA